MKKEITKTNKDGNESGNEIISYEIKFIDSAWFMASSLSNLVDNLTEEIHTTKCKDCDCFFEYERIKDILIKYECLSCNKDYSNKLDEELKKKLQTTFQFSNNDINKFILLLKNGVYPYDSLHDWEKFNETTLPKTEEFYSNLNMEEIMDVDYMHLKRVCKDFEIKNLSEYHDLHLKNDTLLLADAFENFIEMYSTIYQLNPVKFSFSISNIAALKKYWCY